MRLGFVVPRYGRGIVGGAEALVRDYATRLVGRGHHVEVLTTCAVDHHTWENELPPGHSTVDGVEVHRFPVTERKDHSLMTSLHARMDNGFELDPATQRQWVDNTGRSRALLRGIEAAHTRLDALLFAPYLFSSTVDGVLVRPGRSLVIPCLHDEVYARFAPIQASLRAAAGLLCNSPAEARLVERLLGEGCPPHRVVGGGFDAPAAAPAPDGWRARRGVEGALVAYAGRREAAKNFPLLAAWTAVHSAALDPRHPVRLAAMGSGPVDTRNLEWVVDLGVVDAAERQDAMAASVAVAQLSLQESFSFVLGEAWLAGSPVIVHAGCAVTRDHCTSSGGGVWVETAEEYSAALSLLVDDASLRARMAQQGREYILDEYGWDRVIDRLESAIASMVTS